MGILREPTAWIVILVVILLFGAKRLPDVARGVGRSMRIFKAETEGLRTDGAAHTEPPAVSATPAPAPVAPPAPAPVPTPRYLIDPVTGEQVLAQPVTPPADGAPRA
ncbi:MAG TPA: Sec-independent protein translocase subunit TatA [Candidatus Angelobacter sp.]|nr:Sec-independent protein translocase subunit TatA [Candidatus Angelobacter sp.]